MWKLSPVGLLLSSCFFRLRSTTGAPMRSTALPRNTTARRWKPTPCILLPTSGRAVSSLLVWRWFGLDVIIKLRGCARPTRLRRYSWRGGGFSFVWGLGGGPFFDFFG